jgi:hypothetical protein
MADGQHKLSRRALLGAPLVPLILSGAERSRSAWSKDAPALSPVIPAQAGTPARPAPSPSPWDPGLRRDDESLAVLKWDRALARFAAAEAAIAAAAGAADHVYDPIGARHHAALRRLLRTPAPSLAALARKLELALDERTVEFDGDSGAMKTLKQDAHRLAASAG